MERKYLQPPEKPVHPRIGPQFQAQIPELKPSVFESQKRQTEVLDTTLKKRHLNN
jgi:hypothetical protein